MTYRIAEVAELSGVPATAIRYYEDQGLIRPARRESNGYRSYADRDVARLRFVSRARTLDLPIDDLRELVRLWDDEECAGVAGRLRQQAADRLVDVDDRMGELTALAAELRQVVARLEAEPAPGACDDGCVCVDRAPRIDGLPLLDVSEATEGAIACTLDPTAMPDRLDDWHRLLGRASAREAIPGGVSIRFPADPGLAAGLAELATNEQGCCSFFTFTLGISSDGVRLDVTAPPSAAAIVAELFGAPAPAR